ncbi:MmgE/PrpD family protein [Paracoccus gahaiensis]|uniref:MmgE/PrpD family protein n=1 Tax=Paracoccus gahaiensis TaxID=1706839 RepID=A0A4U0R788_9RHOB|nr:MmgE/PrpD family protein [Paracoccus gahaiensis]TJZ90923.1 MmgE/PrpD family protein [Paracoccus gahaiensis]
MTQTQDPATEALLDMGDALRDAPLPDTVTHAATRHLLDTTGAILAGMDQQVSRALAQVLAPSATTGGMAVPGAGLRLPPDAFAYLTGTAGHGIELDDGYRQGTVHPGVAVVPALLAATHLRPVSGAALLRALVIGYETVCALAEAMHPGTRQQGFHPTSVAGPMGAAMAVGQILGLDRGQMGHALGLAASGAGGLFAFLSGGGDVKRLHGGQAARAGLLAAQLAQAGVTAPAGIIGAPSGFAQAFAGVPPGRDLALRLPPEAPFRILDCYIKPHACCRHLQPAFEAAVHLCRTHKLQPSDIRSVQVETYSIAAHHARVGWGDFASAQLSFPYVMALAILQGRADLALFGDAARADPRVADLAGRITVTASPDMDARYPRQRPACVTLLTATGEVREDRSEASGCREMPLPDDRLRAKFRDLAGPGRAAGWDAALWSIADAPDAAGLIRRLCDA